MTRTDAAETPAPSGQGRRPRGGHSPFASTAPSILAAVGYGGAALVWVLAGASLPGGRWLAVHLFTLGVLTNVVLAFSEHFGRTLTRTPVAPIRWQAPVANVGILTVLVGLPTHTRWAISTGATIVTGVVLVSYWRLRQMRKQAVGARFGWIVRAYERVLLLFATGAGTPWATPLRVAAATAIAVYARAVTVVCLPVVTAARGAKPSATRWAVIAVGVWFPIVAWADVAVVATGRWRLLDAVGLALFVGVLAQTVTAVLAYLTPMLRHRGFDRREQLLARLGRGADVRAALWNAGAAAVVVAALVRGQGGAVLARGGWAAVAVCALWLLVAAVTPSTRSHMDVGDRS